MAEYFQYGIEEIEYLKRVDKKLSDVIAHIGIIKRAVIPDLFTALVYSIVGQQISTKAHNTIWKKMKDGLGDITPHVIDGHSLKYIQQFGITFRKASYIKSAAKKIKAGEFDLASLSSMTDDEVCKKLCELDGVGDWTAEMLMIFSMQRKNILSYGDFAIRKGLQLLYDYDKINKAIVEKHKNIYSPYASIASLYLWAVAGGRYVVKKAENSDNDNSLQSADADFIYSLFKEINSNLKIKNVSNTDKEKIKDVIKICLIETELGTMVAGSTSKGLCMFEFIDYKHIDLELRQLVSVFNVPLVKGNSPYFDLLRIQLKEYFSGKRFNFDIPLDLAGSEFQKSVWLSLLNIPYGSTTSYGEQAKAMGKPSSVRAVANANGKNKISILIPCHRVIGSDGSLTGYAGGIWKKKKLLELEQMNKMKIK